MKSKERIAEMGQEVWLRRIMLGAFELVWRLQILERLESKISRSRKYSLVVDESAKESRTATT